MAVTIYVHMHTYSLMYVHTKSEAKFRFTSPYHINSVSTCEYSALAVMGIRTSATDKQVTVTYFHNLP